MATVAPSTSSSQWLPRRRARARAVTLARAARAAAAARRSASSDRQRAPAPPGHGPTASPTPRRGRGRRRNRLALLAAEPFDAILCDLMMPEMSGIDVFRTACALARTARALRPPHRRGLYRRGALVPGVGAPARAHQAGGRESSPGDAGRPGAPARRARAGVGLALPVRKRRRTNPCQFPSPPSPFSPRDFHPPESGVSPWNPSACPVLRPFASGRGPQAGHGARQAEGPRARAQ